MHGIHLTADLFECACTRDLLTDRGMLQEACIRLVRRAGLTVVGDDFHQFANFEDEPGGVTGLVLLAESHLAVHTWPELNAVTLDVYVCNFKHDNTSKAQTLADALVELFVPERSNRNRVQRGVPSAPETPDEQHLALEWLTPDVVHGFAQRRAPVTTQSPLQRLEWHDTRALGRALSLDGAFMVSERDEFIYHECMVHVPALTHPAPRSAFIMGGGDGCTARELLKYPRITRVVIAELDAMVIASCREHFSHVNQGAFDDSRVEIVIGDAVATLRDSAETYDLIIMDLTDPGDDETSAANTLYSAETYALIRSRLTSDGLMTAHIGSAFYHPERFRKTLADLRSVFPQVAAYKAFMPIYGAEWGMACASMRSDPAALDVVAIRSKLAANGIEDLKFYTPRVHASLFAWPAYAEALGA
ncbi:MAG: polyamine aminopropyltransferase [Casimicrobium sp.]